MSSPKFSIGEQVILQSQSYPELNGECEVVEVHSSTGGADRGGNCTVVGGFAYLLTIKSPIEPKRWHEVAIKKKHQSPEFSFYQLMDNLKIPQKDSIK